MNPLRIYDYLCLARGRILDQVRTLTDDQYRQHIPVGLGSLASTLTHTMVSEWYYIERLTGREVPPYEQWPIRDENPPAFSVLEQTWALQAQNIRAAIAAERDWSRSITWHSFPDEQGRRFHITATAGDFFTQLAFHEVHHRSQAMSMLRRLGRVAEDLDFNAMMFTREPA